MMLSKISVRLKCVLNSMMSSLDLSDSPAVALGAHSASRHSSCLSFVLTTVFLLIIVACYLLVISNPGYSLNRMKLNQTALQRISKVMPTAVNRQRRIYYDKATISYFVDPLDTLPWHKQATDEELIQAEEDEHVLVDATPQTTALQSQGETRARLKTYKDQETPEVLSTVQAAIQYRHDGKHAKAKRLLEHAIALAPLHPDVLTEYGLYMECITKDVVTAESMYTRALSANPFHPTARESHERTQPLVEEIDNRMLNAIDKKRADFLDIPRQNSALRRAMKESYFWFIYHTCAIEGNSMNFVQTKSILETKLAVAGKSVMEHNEILGMDAALRHLNRTLINRIGGLSLKDILDIHRLVFGFVDPVLAGTFRTTQVYVGNFVPVHPTQVQTEMVEFINWLNDEDTVHLHPVELAALAHYKFVYIHPFIDGNGRTARLLMNLILMQAGFPPVTIRITDRLEYYETLSEANEGDLRPFIRFIARATDRTLGEYLEAVAVYPTQATAHAHLHTEHDNQRITQNGRGSRTDL